MIGILFLRKSLNPVIALTITDFEMFPEQSCIISRYRLKEKDSLTDYSDDIELVFVELPKFSRELDELGTLTDKWLYFLRSANKLKTAPPSLGKVPALHHAFEVAKQSKLSKKELELLEKREMFLHDNRNAILKARQDGDKQARVAIARSLLDLLDIKTISQKTGLSILEIQALQ
jgi:predicted transposase/invertase (TIGR01784 family)